MKLTTFEVAALYLLISSLLFYGLLRIGKWDTSWGSKRGNEERQAGADGPPSFISGLRASLRTTGLCLLVFWGGAILLLVDCHPRALLVLAVISCIASIFFRGGRTATVGVALGSTKFAVYLVSVFTCSMLLFIYLPVTIFMTSPGDIGIHLGFLMTTHATSAMVVVILACLLYSLAITPRMKTILALASLVILVLSLVYSYVLPFGYPLMNGMMFEQIPIPGVVLLFRVLLDVVMVLLVTILVSLGLRRWGGRPFLLGAILVHLSVAGAAGIAIARDISPQEERVELEAAADLKPLRYSKESNNVLILVLDRLMGGYVEPILEERPALRKKLEGFTWYPRTLSPGENSISGVHALLGGYDYTPQEMNRRDQLLREISTESYSILPYNFTRKGYDVQFVNPRGLGFTMKGDCSQLKMKGLNCTQVPSEISRRLAMQYKMPLSTLSKSNYADLLLLLASMRSAPYLVKAVLQQAGPWRPFMDHSAGTTFREWAELKALPEMSTTTSNRPNLNILFNLLPHEPYFIGEDDMPRAKQLDYPIEEIKKRGHDSLFAMQHYIAARCTLQLAVDYLDWMKKAGIYDNTKIIIVSDHGIVGPVRDRSSRAVEGGTTDSFFVRTRSTLLVKERGAHGDLRVSEAFMPNAEVPRIACEEIGGGVNPYLQNRTLEAHGRDVPFLVSFVPWQFSQQKPKAFVIQDQVVLGKPDPYDFKAWGRAPRP